MKENIAKIYNTKIINYIFILFPIIELITSFQRNYTDATMSIGSIYKFCFVIYVLVYLLFFNKYRKKTILMLLGGLLLYSFVNILFTTNIFTQIVSTQFDSISKLVTFILSFIFFICFIKNGNKLNITVITYIALIYTLLINIAIISNTAVATYENDMALGTTGWYYSANELNVLLAMFLPITLYNLAKKADIVNLITNILLVYSLLSIGTKTSLIVLLIALGITITYSLVNKIKNKTVFSKRLFKYAFVICLFTAIILPYTASYNHFVKRLHYNFDSTSTEQITSEEQLDNFIYNGRNEYLKAQKKLYKNASASERILGLKIENRIKGEDGVTHKLIEIDPYDIAISYGIVGSVIYYSPIILAVFHFIYLLYTKTKITEKNILTLIGVLIVVCISTIAGHVLLSSTIVIFLAYFLAILTTTYTNDNVPDNVTLKENVVIHSKSNKKKLIICTQRLSIGGMERSYINLLNMSDITQKYDVWAYITYVKDKEYIKSLPNDINVHIVNQKSWNMVNKIISAFNIIKDSIFIPKFDVAICYGHSNGFLSLITRRASKNSIVFIHADLANRSSKQLKRLNTFMRYDKFKKVVCVSNKAKKSYIKLINTTDVAVINNYINAEDILKLSQENVKFSLDKKYINLVIVSRLEEKSKKITRAIYAINKLIGQSYNVKIYIIGNGPDENMYKNLVHSLNLDSYIEFLGPKTNPYPYIKMCDALLFTSIYEGYGIVLDEARILNIPFISTDVADAKKIAKKGYGIVCKNSDKGVYEGIKEFLDKGYIIKEKFNYNKFNETITNSLNKLLEDKNA